MSQNSEVLCWLCVNICHKFKHLYNQHGHINDTYLLAVKYFDPMIFKHEGQGHNLIVMCLRCWQHIYDFDNFRESVLLAQTKLLEVDKDVVYTYVSPTTSKPVVNRGGIIVKGSKGSAVLSGKYSFTLQPFNSSKQPSEATSVLSPTSAHTSNVSIKNVTLPTKKLLINSASDNQGSRSISCLPSAHSTQNVSAALQPTNNRPMNNSLKVSDQKLTPINSLNDKRESKSIGVLPSANTVYASSAWRPNNSILINRSKLIPVSGNNLSFSANNTNTNVSAQKLTPPGTYSSDLKTIENSPTKSSKQKESESILKPPYIKILPAKDVTLAATCTTALEAIKNSSNDSLKIKQEVESNLSPSQISCEEVPLPEKCSTPVQPSQNCATKRFKQEHGAETSLHSGLNVSTNKIQEVVSCSTPLETTKSSTTDVSKPESSLSVSGAKTSNASGKELAANKNPAEDLLDDVDSDSSDDLTELYFMYEEYISDVEEHVPFTKVLNSRKINNNPTDTPKLKSPDAKETKETTDPLHVENVIEIDSSSDAEEECNTKVNNHNTSTRILRSQRKKLPSPTRDSMFMRRYHLLGHQNKKNNSSLQIAGLKKSSQFSAFRCKICEKRFSTKMVLQWHMQIKHKLQLPQELTKKPLKTKANEIDKIRTAKQSDTYISQRLPKLKCERCETSRATYTQLRIHHYQHHRTDSFYVVCCNTKLFGRYSVEEHLRNDHYNEVACKLCSKLYTTKEQLCTHISEAHCIRTIGLDLKCGSCEASCATIPLLHEHYRLKHPNKQCSYLCCKRKFAGRSMHEHVRLHQFKASLENDSK